MIKENLNYQQFPSTTRQQFNLESEFYKKMVG